MEQNWTLVYSTTDFYEAEILKTLLIDNEIEAVSINKKDSAYLFGEIELYVYSENVIPAMQIITKHLERE